MSGAEHNENAEPERTPENGEQPAARADVEAIVGYGRPPAASRFKPGQSGNPRGRPKGARSLANVVAATLKERVIVTENGRKHRITKLQAAIKQLVNRAAAGELRSMQLLMALARSAEAEPQAGLEQSSEADLIVLQDLQRRFEKGTA